MTKQIYPKMALNEAPLLTRHSGSNHAEAGVEPAIPAHSIVRAAQTLPASNLTAETDELLSLPQPGLSMGRSLAQILVVLVVLLILVNIPFASYGPGLAQLIPQATPLVIHDGLVLKGSGPELYVLEDHQLRQISSPETFEHYFKRNSVATVEDRLIEQFGQGQPIRRLVKCQSSPTIYALENGRKRWVKDPPSANAAKPWDRATAVSCAALHRLPDGLPIPEDAGLPPQP